MKKISREEFNDYMEYKRFMKKDTVSGLIDADESMSLDELDQITAARGNEDFTAFLQKIKDMEKEEDK